MDYFRALFAVQELSTRALTLVTAAIRLNPANYTAWYYRRKLLTHLQVPLAEELVFLDAIIVKHEKNYQNWHHRQRLFEDLVVVDASSDESVAWWATETAFLADMLESDSKNYHLWSYRQWLFERFFLRDAKSVAEEDRLRGIRTAELEFTLQMLHEDLRNNSVWNYRFFLICKIHKDVVSPAARISEIHAALALLKKCPYNESGWNYVTGMWCHKRPYDGDGKVLEVLESATREFIRVKRAEWDGRGLKYIFNIHAAYVLLQCNVENGRNADESLTLCDKLMEEDAVRKKFWQWQKSKIVS